MATDQLNDKMETIKLSESNNDKKRADYLEWSEYFMAVSFLSAMRSKDPATQVRYKSKILLSFATSLEL